MKKYKKAGTVFLSGLMAVVLGGCSMRGADENSTSYGAAVSMEDTPVIDYTLPRMLPGILADREGYQIGSQKEVSVKGHNLPENFSLVNADTREVVYDGKIVNVMYHDEQKLYTGVLDFGEYGEEGFYYLTCDIVGQSYPFSLEEDFYLRLFTELSEEILAECEEGSAELADVLALLNVCERYPEILRDEDENQAPDTLEAIGQWIRVREEGTVDTYEGALYAAFLAKFSYIYQNYNRQYATQCLQRASAVFEQTQDTLQKDAENFFALTELYRATGMHLYGNQIKDYRSYFENNSSYLDEWEYLYGIMTYLATRQRVDRELCADFMENLMDRGEEISGRYREMIHPVTAKNNGSGDLLKQAGELSCANYILNNYQYTKIIENILHYLMGGNQEAVSFYEQEEERAGYIMLFAQLAAGRGQISE